VKRYDIHWACPDPVSGAEMAKTRPVVIVSLDVLNANLKTVTICPLTSQLHPGWRSRLRVQCAGRPAEIAVDQIRTVSKARLGHRIGAISPSESALLRRLIAEMYCDGV
jgi:mRNA interferase MazF